MDPETTPVTEERAETRGLVLIAEDDETLRELLAMALRRDGYAVIESRDGLEALEYFSECMSGESPLGLPHVVVCDVIMPGCSGIELLEHIAGVSDAPAIVMTASGDVVAAERAARSSAAYVLEKPFELAALRSAVRMLAAH